MAAYEIAGWIGALILLAGFIWGVRIPGIRDQYAYLIINFTGAVGIVINAAANRAYPVVAFNAVWAGYSLYEIIKKCLTISFGGNDRLQ